MAKPTIYAVFSTAEKTTIYPNMRDHGVDVIIGLSSMR